MAKTKWGALSRESSPGGKLYYTILPRAISSTKKKKRLGLSRVRYARYAEENSRAAHH